MKTINKVALIKMLRDKFSIHYKNGPLDGNHIMGLKETKDLAEYILILIGYFAGTHNPSNESIATGLIDCLSNKNNWKPEDLLTENKPYHVKIPMWSHVDNGQTETKDFINDTEMYRFINDQIQTGHKVLQVWRD